MPDKEAEAVAEKAPEEETKKESSGAETYGFDDEIENDNSGLPPGKYPFDVIALNKGFFEGSEKMPECYEATYTIRLKGGPLGDFDVDERFFLVRKMEWKVCQFFTSIGHRKKGEKINPKWDKAVGASGMCEVSTRKFKNDQGEEREFMNIKAYLPPAEDNDESVTQAAEEDWQA